ncbi:MAG: thioredoxin domain-containing protein [Gemmatimonadetes bacterium]|nr:thioredoxin domain-containing protein [Gemmatimonadota bacterium]
MDEPPRNSLGTERSPFLRHGAAQPVHWAPWGEAAFERARRLDRPVLLDIGAIWCHWCHVMDRESYEDPALAALINEQFVPVKVDRDERPDVDGRYQRAVQLLTGQGGWPLTAFLTPDGEAFYGGTYFPPEDGMGRPSFGRVLREIARIWREERDRAREAARSVRERLGSQARSEAAAGELRPELIADTTAELARNFDSRYGGFGNAPKFPSPGVLDLLLDEWLDGGEPRMRRLFEETLVAMARGGIHDQLGGGFHRYATDARWLVPHFEKMAYDNGPLLATYARAWAVTGQPRFRAVCDGIIDHYLALSPELLAAGGFPASQDADVGPDDDGDYWTWTRGELLAAVAGDERRAALAARHWGLDDGGARMRHDPARHVLFEAVPVAQVAAGFGMTEAEARQELKHARAQLRAARRQRPQPYVDRTQYSGWVALVAAGCMTAARYAGRKDAATIGLRALDRLLASTSPGRGVPHRVGDPESEELLEDEAFLLQALLDAFELTQDAHYLQQARVRAQVLRARFGTGDDGAFQDRASRGPEAASPLAAPQFSSADAPTPAGNAVAALSLFRLAELTGEAEFRAPAEQVLRAFAGAAERQRSAAATYMRALGWATRDPVQVVVVGAGNVGRDLLQEALRMPRPRLTVRWLDAAEVSRESLPAHLAALVDATHPRAYVCVGRSCRAPVAAPEQLRVLLAASAPAGAGRGSLHSPAGPAFSRLAPHPGESR